MSSAAEPLESGKSPEQVAEACAGLHDLMLGYVDGDRRAFEALYSRLGPRLRSFALRLVRDEAAAEDVVQLSMLKAHLARERFAPMGPSPDGAVQAWYFAIARNAAMDVLRRRSRRDNKHLRDSGGESSLVERLRDEGPSAEEALFDEEQRAETIERVRTAIAQLPSGQREVVELHKLQGMSMAQVSQRLQIREGAARVRAHRGYKALARLLGAGLWPFLMLTNPTFDSPGVGSDENGFGHRAKVTSAATPADLQPRERWGVLGAWRR